MAILDEQTLEKIQKRIDEAIETRKARINPAEDIRPVVLSCLENLTNAKLIAAIINEPVAMVESFIDHRSEEQLKSKLPLLLKRAEFLRVKRGLEKDFRQVLLVNVDTKQPGWISGARTIEALLEIGEALAAREDSEEIAVICERLSSQMTPRKMAIVLGWLETYMAEGKEFVAWLGWYRAERQPKRRGYLRHNDSPHRLSD